MKLTLDFRQVYPKPARPHRTDQPIKHWDYYDELGKHLFRVVKYEHPKAFGQWKKHSTTGLWIRNVHDVRRVLYRLPQLTMADPDVLVFVCEGEKDADTASAHGLVATTAPMGAGKWRDEYSEVLRDRWVVVIPDNDLPGLQHAKQVVRSLKGKAAYVMLLELPGLGVGQDLTDWFEQGHTRDDLMRLMESA